MENLGTGARQQTLLLYLYRTRAATGSQIFRSFPNHSRRLTRHDLQRLKEQGLARSSELGGGRAWSLTEAGHASALQTNRVHHRAYVDAAQTTVAAHLYGINEVGASFARWASQYNDECEWEVEVAHPYGRKQAVIADAVLRYTVWRESDDTPLHLLRFIEYDRGTESLTRLVAKLRAYLSLRTHPTNSKTDRRVRRPDYEWQDRYSSWPPVLFVFGDIPELQAQRRANALRLSALADPYLDSNMAMLPAATTTVEKLQTLDPFRHPIITTVLEGDEIPLSSRR